MLSLQFNCPSGATTRPLEELPELDELDELDVVELAELDAGVPGSPPQAIRESVNTIPKRPVEYFIFYCLQLCLPLVTGFVPANLTSFAATEKLSHHNCLKYLTKI